jgi:hypothetical protein
VLLIGTGTRPTLAKDAALLAPRWRSFWLSDRPGCASNASVGKLGDPVCCESERGETTRQAASPMKIQRLVAIDRSEPLGQIANLFHFPRHTRTKQTHRRLARDANSLFEEHVVTAARAGTLQCQFLLLQCIPGADVHVAKSPSTPRSPKKPSFGSPPTPTSLPSLPVPGLCPSLALSIVPCARFPAVRSACRRRE